MDLLDAVRQNFQKKLQVLYSALETAKIAQREAPSAMESHSNTTRSEMEKMVTALEIDIDSLKKQISQIPQKLSTDNKLWKLVEIKNMKILVVPEGMGGEVIGEIRLVSVNAPIIKNLGLKID